MVAMWFAPAVPIGIAHAEKESNIMFQDDFESGTISSSWKIESGTYVIQNSALTATHVNSAISSGDSSWTDYTIESKVRLNHDGAYGGIMFRFQDINNHYWLRLFKPASGIVIRRH